MTNTTKQVGLTAEQLKKLRDKIKSFGHAHEDYTSRSKMLKQVNQVKSSKGWQ